jgi:hypothetical protein
MLAKAVDDLPSDDGWLFEPKWDGFRALVFRDGDDVYTVIVSPVTGRTKVVAERVEIPE